MEKLILPTCEKCGNIQIVDKWVEATPKTMEHLEKFYEIDATFTRCDTCVLHAALTTAAGVTT
jgi:hypothetical protein